MSARPPHRCSYPGCRVLLTERGGRCPLHLRVRPPKATDPFYTSRAWLRVRSVFLRRHPLCARCGRVADTVHHRTPIKEGGAHLDPDNLESLCHSCHSREHHGCTS